MRSTHRGSRALQKLARSRACSTNANAFLRPRKTSRQSCSSPWPHLWCLRRRQRLPSWTPPLDESLLRLRFPDSAGLLQIGIGSHGCDLSVGVATRDRGDPLDIRSDALWRRRGGECGLRGALVCELFFSAFHASRHGSQLRAESLRRRSDGASSPSGSSETLLRACPRLSTHAGRWGSLRGHKTTAQPPL